MDWTTDTTKPDCKWYTRIGSGCHLCVERICDSRKCTHYQTEEEFERRKAKYGGIEEHKRRKKE